MSALYDAGPNAIWSFLFLTIILSGAASMATGRALALTWRPIWHCIAYAVPLAATTAFLHYALFEEPVIPLEIIMEDVADANGFGPILSIILWNLRGVAVQFIILAGFALTGYRLTRVRQMASQYSFAYGVAGPFSWHQKTGA